MIPLLLLLLTTVLAVQDLQEDKVSGLASRDPKLFYISSSTTTTTLKTSSICYKTSGTLATCSKKKRKRDIMNDALEMSDLEISPSRNGRMDPGFDELDSSQDANHRDPKFLLYWATLTSTSTSYTATQTIYSLGCTPTGFGTSIC